jgi:hypothetical protein
MKLLPNLPSLVVERTPFLSFVSEILSCCLFLALLAVILAFFFVNLQEVRIRYSKRSLEGKSRFFFFAAMFFVFNFGLGFKKNYFV